MKDSLQCRQLILLGYIRQSYWKLYNYFLKLNSTRMDTSLKSFEEYEPEIQLCSKHYIGPTSQQLK